MAFCLGLIRIIAIGPDVRIKLAEASHYICIAAVIAMPGSINTACKQLVFTASGPISGISITTINSKAIGTFGIIRFIISQLIHIITAVKTAAGKLSAAVSCPNAITIYCVVSKTQISQTLTQTVVGITPESVTVIHCREQYSRIIIYYFFYFG